MSSSDAPSPSPGAHTASTPGAESAEPALAGRPASQGHGPASQGHGPASHRAGYGIAGLPGGHRTKYAVAALWLAVAAGGGLAGRGPGVYITGPAGGGDPAGAFPGIGSTLLYATLGVSIVLLLTYRSPVLWLLPVISASVALTSAEAVLYLLARHAGLTVGAQSPGILALLVLGTGTGYALLLITRYREELRRHEDRHEAMAVALRRAGPAVIASAATVAAGLLCLLAAGSGSARGLEPVAAIGAGAGLLAMVTLLPALLVLCGRWVFWPLRPRYGSPEPAASDLWARTGSAVARCPRPEWTSETSGDVAVPAG